MNASDARARSAGVGFFGGSDMSGTSQPSVGGNLGFSTGVSGSATGPALILIVLTLGLVAHYIWTRGVQGGR